MNYRACDGCIFSKPKSRRQAAEWWRGACKQCRGRRRESLERARGCLVVVEEITA